MRLGIAVTTFNRAEMLRNHLSLIRSATASAHTLVVCDDGSSDETLASARDCGADAIIAGVNRGIAWNKNRGLFYLHNYTDCDAYILLDDDVYPRQQGWDLEWVYAVRKYGHVNFCRDLSRVRFGSMTARDPGLADQVAGACIGVSREAISRVGYFDTRFGRYGHEHSDFSFRLVREGLGGLVHQSRRGTCHYFYVIEGGINERPGPSHVDLISLRENEALLLRSSLEDVYRSPWRSDEQRRLFLDEVSAAFPERHLDRALGVVDLDEIDYFEANDDVKRAGVDALQHYLSHGCKEGRPLRPLKQQGHDGAVQVP